MTKLKIPVSISSCLLGDAVRFDGGHKRDAYIVGTLSHYFEFHSFCPEMAIGLGVPRPTMRLIKKDNAVRCVVIKDYSHDVTDRLRDYAEQQNHSDLCGYIVKKDLPSCGTERVKVFVNDIPHRDGVGVYADVIMRNHPLLPVEEEGRLGDAGLRENFIQRAYVLYRWKRLLAEGLSVQSLMNFHARHKLIIMSHADYRPLRQLLACATQNNIAGSRYFCERFLGVLPKNQQKLRDRYAFGCPSRPGHSFATQQGVAHMLSNDSTRCRKACIFTTLSLRENTCTIASGDCSTPVSQR